MGKPQGVVVTQGSALLILLIIVTILCCFEQMKPMYTTIGTLDPPLGNARLQIAKLVSSILSTNGDTINKELANIGTIEVLWVSCF